MLILRRLKLSLPNAEPTTNNIAHSLIGVGQRLHRAGSEQLHLPGRLTGSEKQSCTHRQVSFGNKLLRASLPQAPTKRSQVQSKAFPEALLKALRRLPRLRWVTLSELRTTLESQKSKSLLVPVFINAACRFQTSILCDDLFAQR